MPNGNNENIKYSIGIITPDGEYKSLEGRGHDHLIYFWLKKNVKDLNLITDYKSTFLKMGGVILQSEKNQYIEKKEEKRYVKNLKPTMPKHYLYVDPKVFLSEKVLEHMDKAKKQGWEEKDFFS